MGQTGMRAGITDRRWRLRGSLGAGHEFLGRSRCPLRFSRSRPPCGWKNRERPRLLCVTADAGEVRFCATGTRGAEVMYEQFGATEVDNTGRVRFRVFVPDAGLDPAQYGRGTVPTIATLQAFGDFQSALGGVDWSQDPALALARSQFVDPVDGRAKGWLYELTT